MDENNLQMLMYYKDAIYKELESLGINKKVLESERLKVFTNLDLEKETSLEKNILNNMQDIEDLQDASVIVDPKFDKIEALTGGINYEKSQFNRATDSKRQVGFTMKPVLYCTALKE